jgi:hypothetical protein
MTRVIDSSVLRAFQFLVPFAKLSVVLVRTVTLTRILLTSQFRHRSFFGELCHWSGHINLLATDFFFFQILAHPVFKM